MQLLFFKNVFNEKKGTYHLEFFPHQKGYVLDGTSSKPKLLELDTQAIIVTKLKATNIYHHSKFPPETVFALINNSFVPIKFSIDAYNIPQFTYVIKQQSYTHSNGIISAPIGIDNSSEYNPTADALIAWADFSEVLARGGARKRATLFDRITKDYPAPTIANDGFFVSPDTWAYFARNVMRNKPTLIIGPKGSGKTELVYLLGKRFGKSVSDFDMSAAQDPVAFLVGGQRLKNKETLFMYSRFAESIQTDTIILLDEISRAPITANNLLLPLFDKRRTLYADTADVDDKRVIKVHDEAVFIATANMGADYVGVNPVDDALLDRFEIVELDYLEYSVEKELLEKRFSINAHATNLIVGVAKDTREMLKAGQLSKCITTRDTLRAAELAEDGFSVTMSMKKVFLTNFEEAERVIVENIINGKS